MKLVECKAELVQQGGSLDDLFKHIEACGRVPYKSEAKSDGTIECAMAFVEKMIKSRHNAVLEHGTVYLTIKWWQIFKFLKYWINPYSRVVKFKYITTNYRVLLENGWLKDLQFICTPTKLHKKRYTFKVLTSIGVTREVNRHRVLSILEQSTRYCDYSKDKFDNQISFCKPSWLNLNTGKYELILNPDKAWDHCIAGDGYLRHTSNIAEDVSFLEECLRVEIKYKNLISVFKYSAQQAREVLPLCTATEAVYTGFAEDWKHFFRLRFFETTGRVHPNMMELSTKMREEAIKANIWDDIHSDPSSDN